MYAIHMNDAKKLLLKARTVNVFIGSDRLKSENLTMGMTVVEPETAMDPHKHIGEEEVIFIIEGYGQAEVGDTVSDIEPYTAVLFPEGVVHRVINKSKNPMKFIFCFNTRHEF